MKKTYNTLILLLLSSSFLVNAKYVSSTDIQPFASNFSCSKPDLQWQFDHLPTLFDQNMVAASRGRGNRSFVFKAEDLVRGEGDWLYRGVTNRQFNESQILGLIFNNTTTVSESRWFSGAMFNHAQIAENGDFVTQRANYQNLPYDKRWKAFKHAMNKTDSDISSLLNSSSSFLSGFDEHVRVGSTYNATPQAIQFLTPTKGYAEGYGEFVLHIKEVVNRKI